MLACVFLTTKNNTLILRATNVELGVEVGVPVKVVTDGTIAVPAHIFSQNVQLTETGTNLVLDVVDGNLSLSSKKGKVLIKSQPNKDFPTLPTISEGKVLTIKSETLCRGIRSVSYSASTSQIKPELSSVYLSHSNGTLVFVATDSFRLAEKSLQDRSVRDMESIILPIRNVSELLRLFETTDGDIEMVFTKNQASFSFGKVYITSRLIDGTFPDYKQIIPKEGVVEVTLLKEDLISSLKRAVIFSDTFNQVSFSIKPAKKSFTVSARSADVGEMAEAIPAAISGQALDINFNHRYVSDCFQSIPTDSVTLVFAGPGKPLVVHGVGDPSFRYLVMPMNR